MAQHNRDPILKNNVREDGVPYKDGHNIEQKFSRKK